MEIARQQATEVVATERVDLATIGEQDALILVHPTGELPIADLSAFMRDGGRLAIADDFGRGDALLDSFGIVRAQPTSPLEPRRLRGNHNVLVATPSAGHPLTTGVQALVVNHPSTLQHDVLDPLMELDEGSHAVVLAGAVGSGRLVAIGDSSVLINNMLEFTGNARFARNLVDYVGGERRVWIVAGGTTWSGRYSGAQDAPALSGLRDALERLADAELTRAALSITTFVIAAALLLFAATALPRYSAYARSLRAPAATTVAGLSGRVQYYSSGERNLLTPLMTYRLELESRLGPQLELGTQVSPEGVEAALRARRAAPELVRNAPRLLAELQALELARKRPASPPVVSAARFRAMVARGDRILEALGPAGPHARS